MHRSGYAVAGETTPRNDEARFQEDTMKRKTIPVAKAISPATEYRRALAICPVCGEVLFEYDTDLARRKASRHRADEHGRPGLPAIALPRFEQLSLLEA